MTDKEFAKAILDLLGGKENIASNSICMTRLRVAVKKTVDIDAIKALDGVLSVIEKDTLQIVLGPGVVSKVGSEFSKLTGIPLGYSNEKDVKELANDNKKENKAKHDGPVQRFLQRIANIFVPLIPGIVAAGLIFGITNVINVTTHGAFNKEWWYLAIRGIFFGMFGYLSVYVGMNASKEFGGTPVLGGIMGAMFAGATNSGLPLISGKIILPITGKVFSPGIGGLLAALFMGIIVAYIEKNIRKIMPALLDTFLTPLITLVIGVFLAIIVIQPVGTILTTIIFTVLNFVYNKMGALGGFILSATFLPLVSVGLHQALTPIHVLLNDPNGPSHGINYLLPILMMAGGGQVGAGFALYFKTKNKKLKRLTRDSIPVGMLGIGEPLMYAVTLPLGRPFITACIGAGVGGMLAGIFHIGTVTFGVSGLFGLLIVKQGTQIFYLVSMIAAYIAGFIITWFFGVDENRINEIYGENE